MSVQNLDRIFKPQRIALVGVTENPRSVGGTVLRNVVGAGYRGVIYPVNPSSEAVLGVPCFPSLKALPKTPDLAVICTPASAVPGLMPSAVPAASPPRRLPAAVPRGIRIRFG